MKRRVVSVWWEVWWKKPGEPPCRLDANGVPCNPTIPRGCYPTLDGAREEVARSQNIYLRIVKVTRYRKVKR